jgi:hypothetical protein
MMLWTVDRSDPRQLPLAITMCLVEGRGGMDSASVLFGWEAEWSEDVPDANILREMRGDSVPQNFMDGVRPRWDERLTEMPDANEVVERSCAGRDAEEKRREEPRWPRRRRGETSRAGHGGEEERRVARSSESNTATAWGSNGRRARGRSGRPPPHGRVRSRDPTRRHRG